MTEKIGKLRETLECLRAAFDDPRYVEPDPLALARERSDPRDREIAAAVASATALGGVGPAVSAARDLLARLDPDGEGLARALDRESPARIARACRGWKHRFFAGADAAGYLVALKRLRADFGSLGAAFESFLSPDDADVGRALSAWTDALEARGRFRSNLAPSPARASACKRPLLMLRWLVRRDRVDPGGWDEVPTRLLVVPLDTHMTGVARRLGLLSRRGVDWKAALEVTAAFREIAPDDPVRYDFCLTRVGIRPVAECEALDALDSFAGARREGDRDEPGDGARRRRSARTS